jgi:hypothetical protein
MSSVSTGLTMRLVVDGDAEIPVPTTLRYDATAPFTATAVFHTSEGDVTWVLGRELLSDGLRGAVGHGDVTVWPAQHGSDAVVRIALSSPSGNAVLEAERRDVVTFLRATFVVVPPGAEMDTQDVDAELAALLGDGRSRHH